MMPVGQLQYLRSKVDGKLHPCAVCATDTNDEPKPLIVEVSPGALGNLPGAVELTEQIAGIAAAHNQSCIVLRPTGRGSGFVYQNYGEIDVLEAIAHVASNYAIDRDCITITGSSMGGAATLKQRKCRSPDHVSLATYNLRHNQSYWVTIDQLC